MSATFLFRLPHDALRDLISEDGKAASILLVQVVRTRTDGPALNGALAKTGALQLVFCLLFAAGILASGGIGT